MGFLGDLIGYGARKIVSGAVGGVIDKVADEVNTTLKDTLDKKFPTSDTLKPASNIQQQPAPQQVKQQPVRQETSEKTVLRKEKMRLVCAKTDVNNMTQETMRVCGVIEQCIIREFGTYVVRVKVSPAEFGGHEDARLYTYVMYQNEEPKACIMVTDHNRYQRNEFILAEEAAKKANIPFINFFTQFPNTEEYVTQRLKSYL